MIVDLFSLRQKRANIPAGDVFQYDNLPVQVRVQIVHIIRDAINSTNQYGRSIQEAHYETINDILCREYGLFSLPSSLRHVDLEDHLFDYFVNVGKIDQALDFLELAFRVIERVVPAQSNRLVPKIDSIKAIEELNFRLREAGVGYEYIDGDLVRVDSKFIHAEAVVPALKILNEPHFAGASAEFLAAHEHYRHGRHKECLNDCLKAFESVMKAICEKKGWSHEANATASKLIEVCFANNLIPAFMHSHMTGLRTTLESGVPTVRNRLGGHGQGSQEITVPAYIASYALHLTATNILFLSEAEQALP